MLESCNTMSRILRTESCRGKIDQELHKSAKHSGTEIAVVKDVADGLRWQCGRYRGQPSIDFPIGAHVNVY